MFLLANLSLVPVSGWNSVTTVRELFNITGILACQVPWGRSGERKSGGPIFFRRSKVFKCWHLWLFGPKAHTFASPGPKQGGGPGKDRVRSTRYADHSKHVADESSFEYDGAAIECRMDIHVRRVANNSDMNVQATGIATAIYSPLV